VNFYMACSVALPYLIQPPTLMLRTAG
jgi:hypothetical protein